LRNFRSADDVGRTARRKNAVRRIEKAVMMVLAHDIKCLSRTNGLYYLGDRRFNRAVYGGGQGKSFPRESVWWNIYKAGAYKPAGCIASDQRSEKIREAIFNILAPLLNRSPVLDLFAGNREFRELRL